MTNFSTKKLHHTPLKKVDLAANIPEIQKTKKKIRKIIAIVLVLLGCLFGINYTIQGIWSVKIGTAWDGSTFIPIIINATGTTIPPKKWVTNILIVGIDRSGELADSIMLASLDEEKKSVTMISIPRDLYVAYGTGRSAWKINALYPIGIIRKEGISLLASKVSEVTGQSIHHYIVIDFTAFKYIVNALGGIEVNVEKDLYDPKYPDYDYNYTIFSIKKWLQNLDGETALRYARSRHSTSDFDRSHRQQLIINAIKTKAFSAGIISSPTKISEIIDATRKNINTDFTVGDIVSLGTTFASIDTSNIHVYNLGNDCITYTNCSVWAYLYSPSMTYFGGASAIIPEWAKINHLSYYDRINQFVDFVFRFPGIQTTEQPIIVVNTKASINYSKNLLMEMRKIGIDFDAKHALMTATGEIQTSHINIYWNSQHRIGIEPTSQIVEALKLLDMRIPIHFVSSNEYVTTDGPKIEIVLGNDHKEYFTFAKPVQYLPKIETSSLSGISVSGEKKIEKSTPSPLTTPKTPALQNKNTTTPSPYKTSPGEWEQL